jgi:hypothetical protein
MLNLLKRESAVIFGMILAFPYCLVYFKETFLSAFRNPPFGSEKSTQYCASRAQKENRRFQWIVLLWTISTVNISPPW